MEDFEGSGHDGCVVGNELTVQSVYRVHRGRGTSRREGEGTRPRSPEGD